MKTKLLLSFGEKNVRLDSGKRLFKRSFPMRFEWFALMAYKRVHRPSDQSWTTLDEIARLPTWGGKSRHDTSTNVGRYLRSSEIKQSHLLAAKADWSGPYRLEVDPLDLEFDLPLVEVAKRLQVKPEPSSDEQRAAIVEFAYSYARAQSLVFQGRLESKGSTESGKDNAYIRFAKLALGWRRKIESKTAQSLVVRYPSQLRLLALLAAIDVMFRLGRFKAARLTLMDHEALSRRVDDLSLKARFHLRLAWAYQRGTTGIRSDRAVEEALKTANYYAQDSGDRAALGLLARRTAGYRTKKGLHFEAVNQLMLAVEADLIIGNYDSLQITAGDAGSVIHRLGPKYYAEARHWLSLSIGVARMMKLGRDDAHCETILAKIHVEMGHSLCSRLFLDRAERIAGRAGNRVNFADIKMVRGFWCERFGTRQQLIGTLARALAIFRSLEEFDFRQKERYMERTFPTVWQEVLQKAARLRS